MKEENFIPKPKTINFLKKENFIPKTMIFLKESSESNSQVFSFYDPNEEVFYALKEHKK